MVFGIFSIIIFLCGMITGAVLVRYGYGLGFKAFYRLKEDLPLTETSEPIEQENTE